MKVKLNLALLFVLLTCGLMAQTITITPDQGAQDSYLNVEISGVGTNFQSGTTTCGPLENGDIVFEQGGDNVSPIVISVIADNFLTASLILPASLPTGNYDVQIWQDEGPGCEVSCIGCFQVTEEGFILNVDPDLAGQGEELKVTISGENTVWTQGSSCLVETSNIIFTSGTSTVFTPNSIEVISNDTICAWITVPDEAEVGLYNVEVNAFTPCALSCDDCFEVYEGPEPLIITGGSGIIGSGTTLFLGLSSGSYEDCDLNTENVFLALGGDIIYPTSVSIENDELVVVFDVPEDATPGDYDIIIGLDLDYGCSFTCQGCFQVLMPISIGETSEIDVDVYPNPFDDQFGLYSASVLENATISLFSMTGELRYYEQVDRLDSRNIEMAHLPKGVYYLKVTCSQGEINKRVIHQ